MDTFERIGELALPAAATFDRIGELVLELAETFDRIGELHFASVATITSVELTKG